MRIFVVGSILVTLVLGVSAGPAGAETCPRSKSGFTAYPVNGSIGDPAPSPGEEPLWDELLRRAASEGLTPQELAEEFGQSTVDELYTLVLSEWFDVDKNENRVVCVKPFPPHQHGQPAYFANFVDDSAHVPE